MSVRNGISRVVMLYRSDNLRNAVREFTRALGIKDFEGPFDLPKMGVTVVISWTTGIELIAPFPGGMATEYLARALEEKGEGLFNLIYRVGNLDAAEQRAAANGYPRVGDYIDALDVQESWRDRFSVAREANLPPVAGVPVTLIQINPTRREAARL